MKKIYTASILLAASLHMAMAWAEYADPADAGDGTLAVVALLFWAIIIALYFLPTILAKRNEQCNNFTAILLLNLFLGWSFIGWVVALIMATWKKDKSQESQ